MTPAAHKSAQAKAKIAWLRHAAWGLNHTPHAQRLIEAWEHEKSAAEKMLIPHPQQPQKPSGTNRKCNDTDGTTTQNDPYMKAVS